MRKESEILLVSTDEAITGIVSRGTHGTVRTLASFETLAKELSSGVKKVSLVALDTRGKSLSALDAIVSLRKKWTSQELPILVVEDSNPSDARAMALADDFIMTPFTAEEWSVRLSLLISRYENFPSHYQPARQLNLFQTVDAIATAFQNQANEIQDQADLLGSMLEMDNNEEMKSYFANVETASKQIGKLARTLLDQLNELRTINPAPMSLTPCLERLSREFPADKLQVVVEAGVPRVMGHDKLYDALKELVQNAIDHCDLDVKITLSVSRDVQTPWFVRLRVADNGLGIMSENYERLFTPFFTTQVATKPGLGLWSVFLLVSSLRGEVRAESAFGKGAEFSIYLRCDN